MKTPNSSEIKYIRHEAELAQVFCELVAQDPDLKWTWRSDEVDAPGTPTSRLVLELDHRHRMVLLPVYWLKPSVPGLQRFQDKFSREGARRSLLFVVPELSSRLLAACKAQGFSVMDLNGRCWLRAPGLLVDRGPLPGRAYASEQEPRNIFVGKSERIVRCLLAEWGRVWTQAEIVSRTGASAGLVSRIIQHLIRQGFVEKLSARELQLSDGRSLLREWVDADHLAKRSHTVCYAGFGASPQEFAHRLQQWAGEEKVPLAFTQWIAAWTRHPYTEPVVCSAYVGRLPEQATLEQLGLRQVPDGGKVWLHVPDDDGVFLETQQRDGLTLASDAQIYLDLQRTGLRGPDAAGALLDWEGFGKP